MGIDYLYELRPLNFNFKCFERFVTEAYNNVGGSVYILDDVLYVFYCYFLNYEKERGEVHPNIRVEQIERIIKAMPYINIKDYEAVIDDVGEYSIIIDKHFKTQYRNCDYNINHFFSGNIRALRYYEELY